MKIRDQFSAKFAELAYNGFWFAPEMDLVRNAITMAQSGVDGTVTVKLFKGSAYPVARTSPVSLYNANLSSMDEEGGYNQQDAGGFIRINALRLKTYSVVKAKRGK